VLCRVSSSPCLNVDLIGKATRKFGFWLIIKTANESYPNTEFDVPYTEKNGFGTATKLGTTNEIFVAATKNFAAAAKRFVDRTKHFAVVTDCFCYPYFNK